MEANAQASRRIPRDLVLRSTRSGRLEGRSSALWSVLRDAPPAAAFLRTRVVESFVFQPGALEESR